MEITKKYKWALGGLSIMILLNALILITLWVNRPGNHDRRGERGPEERREALHRYMTRELDLTEDQRESMRQMRRAHFEEARELRRELDSTRKAYFEAMMSPDTDEGMQRDSLTAALTEQYIALEQSMFSHMAEMRSLLDSTQQDKFSRLMKEMMQRRMPSMHNR